MKKDSHFYPKPHKKPIKREFNFCREDGTTVEVRYSIPGEFEPLPCVDKANKDNWVDECKFRLYPMLSITKYCDRYYWEERPREFRIEIRCDIVSIKSLGKMVNAAHLLNAAKMHLTRKFGVLRGCLKRPISILPDTPASRQLNSLKYKLKHINLGEDDEGFYLPLDSSHLLHLHFSFVEREYNSYADYTAYISALVDSVMQSLRVNSEAPAIAFSGAIVAQEEILEWDEFSFPFRYELEKKLLTQGIAKPDDCSFNETSLNTDWVVINNDRKNFLSTSALVPSLNFENFEGKIQVPNAQHPDNPIEKEIARLIDEKAESLRSFLSGLRIEP